MEPLSIISKARVTVHHEIPVGLLIHTSHFDQGGYLYQKRVFTPPENGSTDRELLLAHLGVEGWSTDFVNEQLRERHLRPRTIWDLLTWATLNKRSPLLEYSKYLIALGTPMIDSVGRKCYPCLSNHFSTWKLGEAHVDPLTPNWGGSCIFLVDQEPTTTG